MVIYGTARPAAIFISRSRRGGERDGQVPPVDQIRAGRVAPVNGAPKWPIGVVLVEQVILPLPLDQAIGVVQPVGWRQKVIAWTMRVTTQVFRYDLLH